MISMLRTPTRLITRKSAGRNLLLAMTFLLVLGGLLSPMLPMVEAATISNIDTASRAASQSNDAPVQIDQAQPISAQPLQPVDPEDEPSDAPPPDRDADGIPDERDSCPDNQDTGQDWDADGIDDACDPQEQAVPATIQVNLYWCQAGTDVVNAADGNSLLPSCGEQGNPVQVALVSATNSSPQQQGSAASFPGTVQFNQLAPDSWNLFFQTNDLETQGLFCQGNTSNGNTKPYARYFLAQTSTPGYPIDTLDDEFIICDWFGVPAGMQTTQDGFGDLRLMKYACPEAPPAGADLQWFRTNCEDPMNRVQFNMNTPTVNIQADTGDNGTDGSLTFGGVETGTYQLVEETSTFFEPLAVFCVTVDQQTMPSDTDYTPTTLTGSSIDVTIASDQVVDCLWFNLFDGHSLTIYKWECPTGTTYGQAADYYGAECATQQADVPFKVTDDLGPQDVLSDIDGVQIDGLSGQILIEETIPDGFGFPVVYCHLLNDNDSTLYPSDNGMVTLPAAVDDDYQCNWYNIPEMEGTSLTIYKFECPPTVTDHLQLLSVYETECATQQPGVDFTVTDDNGAQTITSDNDGVQVDGLIGQISIAEIIPPGYGLPAVFCQALNDAEPTSQQLGGGNVTLPAITDDDYQCWFYNIPYDGTTVTIYKWECPVGTLYGQTDSYYSAECATEQPGVPFQITDDIGTQDTTSDTNGRQIDGLVGEFTITEIVPPGFGNPAIFCQLLNDPASTDYSTTSPSVTLPANSTDDYQCWFYNIPTETTTVTIYKWECPVGTLYGQTDSYYSAECATEQPGVPFQITDDNGTQDTTSDTNGRQIDGLVGQFTITEIVPPGFGNPAIFCQLLNDPANTDYSASSPSVTLPANSTDDYQCWFYNIPTETTTVTIYKWECPVGTLYGQTDSYYSAECATEQPGVPFQITDDIGTQDTTSDTNGRQIDGLVGEFTITEIVPPGFGNPAIFCQLLNDPASTDYSTTSPSVTLPANSTDDYQCWFYNIPEDPGTVDIYKWECPEGSTPEPTVQWHQDNCVTPMNGVEFTLTDSAQVRSMNTAAGMVSFTDVPTGPIQIRETIPVGYSNNPFLVCQFTYADGTGTGQYSPSPINGVYNTSFDQPGSYFRCDWYNYPVGPGEITVYKWTCPEGYDRTAWGANPMTDCTQATNGITFKLDQPDPGVDLFSDTGDSVQGAVYFGGLVPGDYTLTEMLDPAVTMSDVFVWQCTGLNTSSVHPTPLSVGQNLTFKIAGGDKIVCHWFNVPMPQYGWMGVYKFNCTTETYVKDVYCYTNQTGQEFNLQMWVNGTGWVTVQSGITDVSGKLTFNNLDAGAYQLIEPNTKACMIKSSNITSGGFIGVNTGQGTTVYVYNCKTPPPPQKTPGKYPNTGTAPEANSGSQWTPGIELAGLLGLMGMHLTRRRMVAGAGLVAAASLPLAKAQDLQPLTADPTSVPGTPAPEVFGCDGTPEAWTQPEGTPAANATPAVDPCNRGAIPMQMRIPVIKVDAPMEYLEIIDGIMQQPTGDTHITWYKETSRLGEVGNGIFAAHVNWYGNPEGIFFRLESLQEGDVIEIDGDNLETYLFDVQWMENFPSDEEPPDEALGITNEKAITLITCGGEWSAALSEYDHRTLVRAVLRE